LRPIRLQQQMIMGRDRPELPAVAEAVRGIGEECRLELLEEFSIAGRSSGQITWLDEKKWSEV